MITLHIGINIIFSNHRQRPIEQNTIKCNDDENYVTRHIKNPLRLMKRTALTLSRSLQAGALPLTAQGGNGVDTTG